MGYNYRFTLTAKKDIDEVFDYICFKLCNKKAALKLIKEVKETINLICLFPYSNPDCSLFYVTDLTVRHKRINNYILVYKIVDKEIVFLTFKYYKKDKIV